MNCVDRRETPMAHTGPEYPRFLAAQAASCVDTRRSACAPSSPTGQAPETYPQFAEWPLAQAIEPAGVDPATLAHMAAAVGGAVYDYNPLTGCVHRVGDVEAVLGYSAGVMQLGQAWWRSLIHSDDRMPAQSVYQSAVDAGALRVTLNYRIRHAGGHYVDILDRATLVRDAAGAVVRVIGCIEDVTETRRTEQAVRDADRRKDEFLATRGHDLRNPLAPIRYALEMIRKSTGDAAAAERASAVIGRQFVQLVRLVDDMLDVSSIACGRIVLHKEHLDLHDILKSAVEAVRPLIDAKQHQLELLLPMTPVHLHADGGRLIQIVTNLLANAVKYTPAGGKIRLAASVDSQSGALEVRVHDTGIGIAATELGRIFEMFARVDDQPGKRCDGLGIGLAVARDLAASHGGSIAAYSDGLGRGSEFVVTLPGDAAAVAPPASSNEMTATHIAAVDDRIEAEIAAMT